MSKLNMAEVAKRLDPSNICLTIADMTAEDAPLCYANAAFLEQTGFTTAEVIGRNCRFLQDDLENEAARAQVRQALANARSTQAVFRNRRKDGTIFDNLVVLEPLTGASDELLYVVGSQFVLDRSATQAKASAAGDQIAQDIDRLLALNERLRGTSRQALARSMAAAVKLWLER